MAELAKNRRAYFDYNILDTFEAGLMLTGQETKSAKIGGAQLTGAYARINKGEAWLINAHIKPYKYAGNLPDYDPEHSRKLLLHKREIKKLAARIEEKGVSLLPLELYTSRGRIKVRIGVGKSKKEFDKRDTIRRREDKIKMQRAIRRHT